MEKRSNSEIWLLKNNIDGVRRRLAEKGLSNKKRDVQEADK